MKGVVCFLVCLCFFSLSGCMEQDERAADYNTAVLALEKREYKEAALLFETLGEFKNSREKTQQCWYAYAERRKDLGTGSLREKDKKLSESESLEMLLEAKAAFERVGEYRDAVRLFAVIDKEIVYRKAWLEINTAVENENYEKVVALLEASGDKSSKARNLLSLTKRKRERQIQTGIIETYLKSIGETDFTSDSNVPFLENLNKLFKTAAFRNDSEKIADALAGMRCYNVIAHGWNNFLMYQAQRKIPYESGKLRIPLERDTLLLAMIKLAESGDDSQDFKGLLSLFSSIVVGPGTYIMDDPLRRYAALLELHNAGPEWVEVCFPGNERLDNYKKPGTMDYRVVNAPQSIKDALYKDVDMLRDRFTRGYTVREATKLFKGFVPSKPLDTGYIYIVDKGALPKGAVFPSLSHMDYQSLLVEVAVTHEPQQKRTPRRDFDRERKIWVERKGESGLIEEKVPRKGKFFCVANPNNARIAIYERYRYQHYGTYKVEGKKDTVVVYLPTVEITIVDLVSGKTLLKDTASASAKARYKVPSGVKPGDTYIPFNFFDRREFLASAIAKLPHF